MEHDHLCIYPIYLDGVCIICEAIFNAEQRGYNRGYIQGQRDERNTCPLCRKPFVNFAPHINCLDTGTGVASSWKHSSEFGRY